MTHIIGRGRYAREAYPKPKTDALAVRSGGDYIVERLTVDALTDIDDARLVPPLPRNVAGDPLQIVFPQWRSGDVLRVDYNVQAIPIIAVEATSLIYSVVRVLLSGDPTPKYLDNSGSNPATIPSSITVKLAGRGMVAIDHNGPLTVQLGLAFFTTAAPDTLTFSGTAGIGTDDGPANWLLAEQLKALGVVQVPSEASLIDVPIPGL